MVGAPRNYHVAASRRGEWPTPWVWEIFHRGNPLKARMWGGYFKTYAAAMRAGRPMLNQFLASLRTEERPLRAIMAPEDRQQGTQAEQASR